MFKEATQIFGELGDIAKKSVTKLRALRKAVESAFQHGDSHQMLELLNKAQNYATADRLENARFLAAKSRALMLQNSPNYIKDLSTALQVFEEEFSIWDVAWALMGVGNFHVAWQGKKYQGLAEGLLSAAIFDELGDLRSKMETYFVVAYNFIVCQLFDEALDVYGKMITMDENLRMENYLHMCNAYAWSGSLLFSYVGNFEKGLAYNLKALELSKKVDSLIVKGVVYSNLVRMYALLGNLGQAEKFFDRLIELPKDIFNFYTVNGEFARAVLLASKGQYVFFEEFFKKFKSSNSPGWLQAAERYYACMLEKQGRLEESRVQLEKSRENLRAAQKLYERANIQATLIFPRQVGVDQEFEMRLDIVNVSKIQNTSVKVKNLIPAELKVNSMPSSCNQRRNCILMDKRIIKPFQVETIKIKAVLTKEGVYSLQPLVTYIDEENKLVRVKIEPKTIAAKTGSLKNIIKGLPQFVSHNIAIKSEASQKVIDYLLSAFEEDHIKRRLAKDESGWRTLMQVVKKGKVSKHCIYGRSGRGGKVISELKSSRLLEMQVFQGQVGRGGNVVKIRIVQNDREL
jgi:tetratricopeptide (TPR) repeat protein